MYAPPLLSIVISGFSFIFFFFFFNDTATTEIYTLSLHDALPISPGRVAWPSRRASLPAALAAAAFGERCAWRSKARSEEHTSELQSLAYLVCRLLLEKKKKNTKQTSGIWSSL